jgi:octaheme c-type cytochrome (tetrathionate reductase family)
MRKIVLVLVLLSLAVVVAVGSFRSRATDATPLDILKATYARKRAAPADHAKFEILQRPFTAPQEVTMACLSCHTERGHEVMASSHWNWSRQEYMPGRGIRTIGKKNVLNNFCIGVAGNLTGCDKCHAGFGYVDQAFDFTNASNIDCLACHDNSGTYERTGGGVPAPAVNLNLVAQKVGRPQRSNCGTCHFFGGGGNNVKHGDLEQAMFEPSRDLDVHMASDGANLQCVDCHRAPNHQMLGKVYSVSSMNRDRSTCEQCHGNAPHPDTLLNEHTVKVACQTCHIPAYARANATKMTWDWSTAGRLRDGKPYEEHDAQGNITYASIKGTFTWATNVTPEYIWFNGTATHYLLGDQVDADRPVPMNTLFGDHDDPDARIIPVKVHRAVQPYDPGTKLVYQPKLVGTVAGDGAYWKQFDWNEAAREGMKVAGLPYSGRHGFVPTEMTWPVNHQVAPKAQSLQCNQCHTRTNSRLAGVQGVYLPGRDRNSTVDALGALALWAVGLGVVVHGLARAVSTRTRRTA